MKATTFPVLRKKGVPTVRWRIKGAGDILGSCCCPVNPR